MTREEIIEVLEALASGADPANGEELPARSPYNDRRVIQALAVAIDTLRKDHAESAKAVSARKKRAGRAGESWTSDEERELVEAFDRGMGIDDLAVRHDRTRGSIETRLMRLGKIQPPGASS